MPLYEYYCPDCKTKFDTLRSISKADEAITCKSCQSERPTRTLSLFAAHIGNNAEKRVVTTPAGGGGCCGGTCGCSH